MAYVRKNVGVIGHGYVGSIVVDFLRGMHNVFVVDPNPAKEIPEDVVDCLIESVNQLCDIAFVCVPTPESSNGGECDVSIVEKVVNDLETPIIVMKSTVEPGTTDRLIAETGKHIVFSPEFAGESVYWSPYKFDRDMKELPYYIFGGDNQDCKIVHDLYIQIGGPTKKYFITDAKTAEMVKYVTNCFYAAKITFCNEVKEICDRTGVEWDTVRQLWLNDPRINPMHTAVFEENRGFGGKCFPKDTAALVRFAEKEGYDAEVLRAVRSANKKFREMNKK